VRSQAIEHRFDVLFGPTDDRPVVRNEYGQVVTLEPLHPVWRCERPAQLEWSAQVVASRVLPRLGRGKPLLRCRRPVVRPGRSQATGRASPNVRRPLHAGGGQREADIETEHPFVEVSDARKVRGLHGAISALLEERGDEHAKFVQRQVGREITSDGCRPQRHDPLRAGTRQVTQVKRRKCTSRGRQGRRGRRIGPRHGKNPQQHDRGWHGNPRQELLGAIARVGVPITPSVARCQS